MAALDHIINLRKFIAMRGSCDDTISEASTELGIAKIGPANARNCSWDKTHLVHRKEVPQPIPITLTTPNVDHIKVNIPGCFPEAEPSPAVNPEMLPAIDPNEPSCVADVDVTPPQRPIEKNQDIHIVIQEPETAKLDNKDHFLPTPSSPQRVLLSRGKRFQTQSSRTFRRRTFIAKICVLSVLLIHAGLLLGYEIVEVTSQTAQVRIMMLILTVLSALGAMVVILTVDAASRGPKRVLALYPLLGAITGAMLWVPLGGGVGSIQHTTVQNEQWVHWMVLSGWLGFLFEFIFGSWKGLFRTVLRKRIY